MTWNHVASHFGEAIVFFQMKKRWRYVVVIFLAFIFLLQLQPEVVGLAGGVAGSFGVRPTSHECFGFLVSDAGKGIFRPGEI